MGLFIVTYTICDKLSEETKNEITTNKNQITSHKDRQYETNEQFTIKASYLRRNFKSRIKTKQNWIVSSFIANLLKIAWNNVCHIICILSSDMDDIWYRIQMQTIKNEKCLSLCCSILRRFCRHLRCHYLLLSSSLLLSLDVVYMKWVARYQCKKWERKLKELHVIASFLACCVSYIY